MAELKEKSHSVSLAPTLLVAMRLVRRLGALFVATALICGFAYSSAAPAADDCDEIDNLATTTPAPPYDAIRWRLYRQELASIAGGDVDLVLLGDSLAQLWPKSIGAPHSVLNLGIGGDGTQHVLWRLSAPQLTTLKPANVLVILGTNNLASAKPCAISAGLKEVIKRVAALWPSAKIIFLEIPPRGADSFSYRNDERLDVNASMRELPNVKTINVDEAITCGWRHPCENYGADNLHFTEAGYRTLFSIIQANLFGK